MTDKQKNVNKGRVLPQKERTGIFPAHGDKAIGATDHGELFPATGEPHGVSSFASFARTHARTHWCVVLSSGTCQRERETEPCSRVRTYCTVLVLYSTQTEPGCAGISTVRTHMLDIPLCRAAGVVICIRSINRRNRQKSEGESCRKLALWRFSQSVGVVQLVAVVVVVSVARLYSTYHSEQNKTKQANCTLQYCAVLCCAALRCAALCSDSLAAGISPSRRRKKLLMITSNDHRPRFS